MDEAERCSRVGLMFEGQLIVCDAPDRIREMVPAQLIELHVTDFRRAKGLLEGLPGVLEVQTYGELLHIFVDDPVQSQAAIQQRLRQAGIDLRGARSTRPRMEEAFISLVRQRSEMATQGSVERDAPGMRSGG
jgi:ABC-2 type transport system ATP-binding protein